MMALGRERESLGVTENGRRRRIIIMANFDRPRHGIS
jgi:hypothetical protein